jgi:hypothetical protein
MSGRIKFTYRAKEDVLVAVVAWHLETDEDLDAWFAECVAYFKKQKLSRKLDVIFELSDFRVHPRVAPRFGELRSTLLAEYSRRTYRVKMDRTTKAFMYTSRALHGAPANDFPTIEAALRQLAIDRARDGQ